MTTQATLTERYVRATTRHVPEGKRDDVARELRASLEDMIEARTLGGTPADAAERQVLTEFGEPERLAATYAGRDLVLIGPRLYLHWWRLLKLLLSIVPGIVAVVLIVVGVAEERPIGPLAGDVAGALFNVVINVVFWVTAVFALIERYSPGAADDISEADPWTPDKLPEIKDESADITLGDTATTVGFLAVVIGFFPFQELRPIRIDGAASPLLDSALWNSWIPVLIGILVIEIIYEIVKYRIGRRTTGLFLVQVAIGLAFAVPVAWLLLSGDMLHPDLAQTFDTDQASIDLTARIAAATVVVIALWDLAEGAWKTYVKR